MIEKVFDSNNKAEHDKAILDAITRLQSLKPGDCFILVSGIDDGKGYDMQTYTHCSIPVMMQSAANLQRIGIAAYVTLDEGT